MVRGYTVIHLGAKHVRELEHARTIRRHTPRAHGILPRSGPPYGQHATHADHDASTFRAGQVNIEIVDVRADLHQVAFVLHCA